MTFRYIPADQPAIWMEFVPARENTASPAKKDNRLTERMVHSGMNNETVSAKTEEMQVEEQVSTVVENIFENGVSEEGVSENTAGPHISSVEHRSQLAECEYQRDCISVGKEQTDRLSDDFFDSLILMTTTDRGRDAVVVGLRKSADQSGSPVDCIVSEHGSNNLPKECCVVAGPVWNDRLRCQGTAWLYRSTLATSSGDLVPPLKTKTGPRWSERAISSQRSSNLNDDSKGRAASRDSRLRGNGVVEPGKGVMEIGTDVMPQRHHVTS